jgi:hypothetical protein
LKSHPNTGSLPELDCIPREALRVLKKLGFKYTSLCLNDGYLLPGTTKEDGTIYKDKELWEHLAKNGLPESCYECDAITDRMELLCLEQFVAQVELDIL